MSTVTLTPEVTDVLSRSTILSDRVILPPGQLDRKLYEAVNKVLTLAGGKWNRSAKAHVFNGDPRVKLGLTLETGTILDEKKAYQAFFTPPELADKMAELAEVNGEIVLEPSAGDGALADACMRAGALDVDCMDLNPECVAKLRTKGYAATERDFLQIPKISMPRYTRIVMNPPFAKNQDVKHVAKALEFLAPGGILVSIMSPNTTRSQFLKLTEGLRHYEIVNIPAGAFKESGTPIATIALKVIG